MEKRKIKLSITNFLHCGDEFLFLLRNPDKKIDPNRLNGVGGKVEPGEDFLQCAIRETKEETGYEINPSQIRLRGLVRLEGGYDDDWVMAFFCTKVDTKEIPLGNSTKDGELIWIHKDGVLNTKYELVDDVKQCFSNILNENEIFFMNATINAEQKVESKRISSLLAS